MTNVLLTNALVHEFQRCRDAFELYIALYAMVLSGSQDKKVLIGCYNAYSDFVSHLYEFYLGCIKKDGRFPNNVSGSAVDAIINSEVEKLLRIRRERILRGAAHASENDLSYYEVSVPEDFGEKFRSVRNIRSHASQKRSEFDLASFYKSFHKFIYLLFEEPQWLWNSDLFPEHNWHAIEDFAKTIAPMRT